MLGGRHIVVFVRGSLLCDRAVQPIHCLTQVRVVGVASEWCLQTCSADERLHELFSEEHHLPGLKLTPGDSSALAGIHTTLGE